MAEKIKGIFKTTVFVIVASVVLIILGLIYADKTCFSPFL